LFNGTSLPSSCCASISTSARAGSDAWYLLQGLDLVRADQIGDFRPSSWRCLCYQLALHFSQERPEVV
jgi:hypothetical protein